MVIDAGTHRGRNGAPSFFKKLRYCITKVFRRGEKAIISNIFVHNFPKSLDGVQIWAVGRQMVQHDGICFGSLEGKFAGVVGTIIQDNMELWSV